VIIAAGGGLKKETQSALRMGFVDRGMATDRVVTYSAMAD
jgi:hypothetical protein